jgi:gluconate 2-dehydrogenase alpha chain
VRRQAKGTDVVIVGLGGTGGIAAQVLTEAGVEVVGLEAGPRLAPGQMRFDEISNEVRNWMAAPKARHEIPTWRANDSEVSRPSPYPMLMANAVGGSTLHYECVSLRFDPWAFRLVTNTIERYGAGAIPKGATVTDWPLTHDDLEPYYDKVEHAIGVSGKAGRLRDGAYRPGGDYFEAARSREYPMPPLRRTGWGELMATAAEDLGWHPFHAPAAINSEPHDGRGACTYCGFCQSNGCHVNAKGSTAATSIPRAERTGLLRVETGARAVAIEVDSQGRATGVRYVQDRVERFQPARVVMIGTFTYENTRLLLLSKSAPFPNGLGNNSGQVGRNYLVHANSYVYGLFPGRRLNLFSGTMAQGVCVNDFNADNFDHRDVGFIGGGMLAAWGELKPITVASGSAVSPAVPRWGAAYKRWLHDNAQSIGVLGSQTDALPYETNYLDLDPSVRDRYGLPVTRVTYRLGRNEQLANEFLTERMREWLQQAGASESWATVSSIEGRHSYGGTRMGIDPATSVVDAYGFAHEVPNLAILGSSVFPSSGGYNPTLTVQALAWRTSEHLVKQWRSVSDG